MCLRTAEVIVWYGKHTKRTVEATVNACSPRTVRTLDNEFTKIAAVGRNPWKSSRDVAWALRLSQPGVHVVLINDQFYKMLWIDIACFINDSLFNFHSCTVRLRENSYKKKSKSGLRFLMVNLEVLSLAPTWYLTSCLIMDILTQNKFLSPF
jgi:hypothetical protein